MVKGRSITERLATLERQAAKPAARAVEAEEFRLVDRAGRLRALLELTRIGPRLAMMREDGTIALELMLTGDGAGARFADDTGKTRVFIGASRGTARLGMADGDGAPRVFLGLDRNGKPTLSFYDRRQRKVRTTRPTPPRADPSGKPRPTRSKAQ